MSKLLHTGWPIVTGGALNWNSDMLVMQLQTTENQHTQKLHCIFISWFVSHSHNYNKWNLLDNVLRNATIFSISRRHLLHFNSLKVQNFLCLSTNKNCKPDFFRIFLFFFFNQIQYGTNAAGMGIYVEKFTGIQHLFFHTNNSLLRRMYIDFAYN